MREHGIDMPDPKGGDGARIKLKIEGEGEQARRDRRELEEATEACKKYAPQLSPEQKQEAMEQRLKFARCMRQHGIDIPDPNSGEMPEIDPESEEFQQAQKACNEAGPGVTLHRTKPGGSQ